MRRVVLLPPRRSYDIRRASIPVSMSPLYRAFGRRTKKRKVMGITETAIHFSEVRDSGKRQEFESGARRDTQDDKPRYGLVPPGPLRRLAMHYTNGAKKYGENNWTKGMPCSRSWESLERHVQD